MQGTPREHPWGHEHPKSPPKGCTGSIGHSKTLSVRCMGSRGAPKPHPLAAGVPQQLTQRVPGAAWAQHAAAQPSPGRGSPPAALSRTLPWGSACLVAQQGLPVSHPHHVRAPAPLQERVLHHHRGRPQPEGGEEVGVDVVPGAAELPAESEGGGGPGGRWGTPLGLAITGGEGGGAGPRHPVAPT